MIRIAIISFIIILTGCARNKFDILLVNGTIIDGTGKPGYVGSLAINGDKIVAIGDVNGKAKTKIDAGGLVVSPGFIDIHTHSEYTILIDGNAESKIRQGVTTEVVGETTSPGPFSGQIDPEIVKTEYGVDTIASLNDYFRIVEKNGSAVNVVSYVGIGNVWRSVMGYKFDPPSDYQLNEMKKIVKQAMEDGAFGLSAILAQPPGSLVPTGTMVELCKVVSEYKGVYATHIRSEGVRVFDAVREAIEIGAEANVPVDIMHLKIADQRLWGRMSEIIAIIDSARREGINVRANVYPYTRGNNSLVTIIPEWAHEGGFEKLIERLKNDDYRKRMKHEIENGIEGWYNHYTAIGKDWSRMLVCEGQYAGLTMDSVIAIRSENKQTDPLDILFDLLIEENSSISTVYAHHTEEDMNLAMKQPWCSIGSDGSALATEGPLSTGNPHPRNFGTFPRVLGYYAGKCQLITLEDAVYKMTGLNAEKLGLKERGTLAVGNFADITIFDPAKIIDKATYDNPFQYNEGIEYVLVNGDVVLKGETHSGKRPGRALKKTGMSHTTPDTVGNSSGTPDTLTQSSHKLLTNTYNKSMEIKKEYCGIKGSEISEKKLNRKPVLQGEIKGINTCYIELLKDRSFKYKPEQNSVSVFLITHGKGIIRQGDSQFEVNGVNLFVPSALEEASVLANNGNLGMLEIIIRLTENELQFFKEQKNKLPYFVDYTKCPQYTEAIKSEKTINRMILPENIVPRFCIGSVETSGPDEVGAHSHPMLEQLFFGLTKNNCLVIADGTVTPFGENILLHIPLGSTHKAIVEEGKILNYVWMDLFRSQEDMGYIRDTHIMKEP